MPIQCPHCHGSVEVEGSSTKDCVCPGCGSSIQLDPSATTGWLPSEGPRRLGRFEFLEHLGTGSFGAVYKARDSELDRLVAVKIPRAGSIPRPEDTDRFLREARSAAQLRHPGIVALYDAGQADGTCYLVSEFVQGATLAQRLSAGRLSFHRAAELAAQVADALHYAHLNGVVHRDIKPSNILLDLKGEPHVMDFGLAKRAADEITMTIEGQVVGTPAYMPPEQARGEVGKIDARSDLYSLGVILYELLTGELPFRGQTRMLLVQVMQDEPRPPRRLNDRIAKDLETICLKAMAKEPGRRYQSAGQLADDLRRYLKGEPILARPVGRLERLWRWCKRKPALAAASGVASAGLLATVVVSLWFARYQQETAASLRLEKAKTEQALDQAQQALHEARRQTGIQMLERGEGLCAEQQVAQGLYWLVQSLKETPPDEQALHRVIRANLGEWLPRVNRLRAIFPHQGPVRAVALSPDGKSVLSGSEDGTARLWEAATGRLLAAPLKHGGPVNAVAFSPDGQTALTGSDDHTARRWEAATGSLLGAPLPHQDKVRAVAFSPDGQRVLTGSDDKTAQLWEAATGRPLGAALAHQGKVTIVAFTPDGKTALTAGEEKGVRLWEAASGRPVGAPLLHEDEVRAAAFSPDGRTLLTGSKDRTARLWETATGRLLIPPLQHSHIVNGVAFSPDGKTLLTGSEDHTARLWEAATGRSIGAPLQHRGRVAKVAFSPDGKMVVTGADDHTARLWDAATGRPLGSPLQHGHWIVGVAFSPDGQSVLTGSLDNTARLWETSNPHALGMLLSHAGVNSAALSPDGRTLLTGSEDQTARLWDTATGQPVGPPLWHPQSVDAVAFGPDGKTLLTGCRDHKARLWSLPACRPIGPPMQHQEMIGSVAVSPDGRTLFTGSDDKTAQLWDAGTSRALGSPLQHKDRVAAVAFSPDGKLVATASWDRTARLWDAETGRPIGTPLQHAHVVWAVAFSRDSKTVVTGSWDHTAQLWEVESGRPIGAPLQHPRSVWGVALSPDGKTVLTGSWDRQARLWDVATGRPIGPPWEHATGVWAVAFSPDGKTALTGNDDKTVRLRPVRAPVEETVEQLSEALTVLTGQELDASGGVRLLDPEVWEARRRLANLPDASWQSPVPLPSAVARHTALAAEAEYERNTFAATWHLNRLMALEPNNWFWDARLARLHAEAGDFPQAEADCARAQACAEGPDLHNWYWHQLADCRAAKQWDRTLWYMDRLVAALPFQRNLPSGHAQASSGSDQPAAASADTIRSTGVGSEPALISQLTREAAVARGLGVIRDWLIVAPLPLKEGSRGEAGLDQEQLPGESDLHPQAGTKARVGGAELVWQARHLQNDFVIDFPTSLGKPNGPAAAYAVCYFVAKGELQGLKLLVGNDAPARICLNGKQIYHCSAARAFSPDADTIENLPVREGTNVLVFKVLKTGADGKGCLRFVDRTGRPARNIRVTLTPNPGD